MGSPRRQWSGQRGRTPGLGLLWRIRRQHATGEHAAERDSRLAVELHPVGPPASAVCQAIVQQLPTPDLLLLFQVAVLPLLVVLPPLPAVRLPLPPPRRR